MLSIGVLLPSSNRWFRRKSNQHTIDATTPPEKVTAKAPKTASAPASVTAVEPPPADPLLLDPAYRRSMLLTTLSLGLATAGVLVKPFIGVLSVPIVLYVSAPRFRAAWQSVQQERRLTSPVLDATRITVCVAMGYHVVAALDVCLQVFTYRWLARDQAEYSQRLRTLFGNQAFRSWVYRNGIEVDSPVAKVMPGSVVVVLAGETIPVRGRVVYGSARVDPRPWSGETALLERTIGDEVQVPMLVHSGQLYVLAEAEPVSPKPDIPTTLTNASQRSTLIERIGIRCGQHMAPLMFVTFILTIPLLGVNHAAAFLTTSFGAYMLTLGPLSRRHSVLQAAEAGFLLKDARILEQLNLINTVMIDAQTLANPDQRAKAKIWIAQLRKRPWLLRMFVQHPFAVYLISSADEEATQRLMLELGCDDYFIEHTPISRAKLVESLQKNGRLIGYIGDGVKDGAAMQNAWAAISLRTATTIDQDQAQVLLPDQDFSQLNQLFELGKQFNSKQQANLVVPIVFDLVDISTTLFLHFGLLYSVLFSYGGLLVGIANTRATSRLPPDNETKVESPLVRQLQTVP